MSVVTYGVMALVIWTCYIGVNGVRRLREQRTRR